VHFQSGKLGSLRRVRPHKSPAPAGGSCCTKSSTTLR
jgi:hypothetical protein